MKYLTSIFLVFTSILHADELSELQAIRTAMESLLDLVDQEVFDELTEIKDNTNMTNNNVWHTNNVTLLDVNNSIQDVNSTAGAILALLQDQKDNEFSDLIIKVGDVETAVFDVVAAIEELDLGQDDLESALTNLGSLASSQVTSLGDILTQLQSIAADTPMIDTGITNLTQDLNIFANDNNIALADLLVELIAVRAAIEALDLTNVSIQEPLEITGTITVSGDTDDDVPTLEQIRDLLGYNSGGNSTGQSVVQGTRNQSGDFESLEDRLGDLNVTATLSDYVSETDITALEEQELVGNDEIIGAFDSFDGTGEVGVLELDIPTLSLSGTSYATVDLFGGFSNFDIPSLGDWATWIKSVIYCAIIFWFICKLKDLGQNWMELDISSTPSQPITNYGGALGGIINLPIKVSILVAGAGFVLAVIAVLAAYAGYYDDFVTSLTGLFGDFTFLTLTASLIDAFIPVAFGVQMMVNFWLVKGGVIMLLFAQTKLSRVVS